ncbi:hypothetical protein GLOIN_2v1482344 [Rhizophagus clarus]|nr:hypothetical protein GLOIN_2v1482344 [Rhizophagus clarus]
MEIILEYTYTGSVKEESLTEDNTIEAFYAADYFQLSGLQDFIIKTVKNTNLAKNYSPELLSKISEKMPSTEDNILLNLLVETVAIIPLNNIEFGRLTITGLKCLLSITHEKETIPFATKEYEVFRYSAIIAAKQVSNDAYESLMERLPTLEQVENTIKVENKSITDHQDVAKELEPLVKYIDFKRIKGQVLVNLIEPLEIIPVETLLSVYRNIVLLNSLDFKDIRGNLHVIDKASYVWDETARGSSLIIEDNGKIVEASNNCNTHQSVRAKMTLENNGIFEWNVIIEEMCTWSWVGVCAAENINYEVFAGNQPTGWVLSSDGNCSNGSTGQFSYCPSFHGVGTRITVHLDMNKRTCAFSVNGTKYREVTEWNNLPSKLYPVVSLRNPGRFRILEPEYKY